MVLLFSGAWLADIGPAECSAHGLAHCDDCFVASSGAVFTDVKFYSVGNWCAAPGVGVSVFALDGGVGARRESGSEGCRDASLECVARHVLHLDLDLFQALAFALSNFDGEKLKQVPVVIGCCGARAVWSVEQAVCYIKPYGTSAWRSTCRRVGWAYTCCVD